MTGYDIYKKALALMGVNTDAGGDKTVPVSALAALNTIGTDLFEGFYISDVFEEIKIPDNAVNAFCCGVAFFTAENGGDTAAAEFFCDLYNSYRAAFKSSAEKIKNVMPTA